MNPVPRAIQVALGAGAVFVSLVLARASWSLGTKMTVFAGVVGLVMLVTLRFERRLPRAGVEPAGPGETMPGTERYVADFESAGLRRIGGYRWAVRGRLVIETVLTSDSLNLYALVTDRVLEVVSRFGDRTLITTNSGRAPVAEDTLRQVVRPGSPAELLRAHQGALDHLASRGLRPDRLLDDDEILRAVLAAEERALRRGGDLPLTTLLLRGARAGDHDRELGHDDEGQHRIEAWLREGAS